MTTNPNNQYVYIYLRSEDDENGKKFSPYYIGCGRGMRWRDRQKNDVLRPNGDRDIFIQFAGTDMSVEDAGRLEGELINHYGLIRNGSGILRNVRRDGGYGTKAFPANKRAEQTGRAKEEHPRWGVKASPETIEKLRAAGLANGAATAKRSAKTYIVIDPDGNEQQVTNLSAFCRENGLGKGNMNDCANGKAKHHKGWQCRKVAA